MSAHREASRTEPESQRQQQSLAFLHQARDVRGLHAAQVERIEHRLKGRSPRPRRIVLLPALAALGLVLAAGAAFALAKGGLRSLPIVGSLFGPLLAPAASAEDANLGQHRRATPKPAVEHPAAKNPSLAIPPVVPAVHPVSEPKDVNQGPRRTLALRDPGDSHRAAHTTEAPVTPAPPPAAEKEENPIVAESRSFASVIEPWHRTRNASTTLALLDAHERRYPSGHMRLESRVLRAEILLAEGRESEALKVLDSMSLSGIPRARELQTVRGELRIKAGRCSEGKRDLDDVLKKVVADALAKRASQAISHCP